MHKKLLILLMAGVLVFSLTSCSAADFDVKGETHDTGPKVEAAEYATVNQLEGVSLRVKEGSIKPTGVTLILANDNHREYQYGTFYCIEKKTGDTWDELPYVIKETVGWDDVAYILSGKQTLEETVEWGWLYGSLAKGEYRIIKEFFDFRGTGDYDKYYLAAEFVIP